MNWTVRFSLVSLLLGSVPGVAFAQTADSPGAFLLTAPAAGLPSGNSGGNTALGFLILAAAIFVVFGTIAKVVDFRKRREQETVELQSQISDALLGGRAFFRSSVTPTVHIPFWRGSPATIEMSGEVTTPHLEQSALRIATQVASRIRPDFSIDNRLTVIPCANQRAA